MQLNNKQACLTLLSVTAYTCINYNA